MVHLLHNILEALIPLSELHSFGFFCLHGSLKMEL